MNTLKINAFHTSLNYLKKFCKPAMNFILVVNLEQAIDTFCSLKGTNLICRKKMMALSKRLQTAFLNMT